MTAPDVSVNKRSTAFGFELQGALKASRNLGAISGRLPYLQEYAIKDLRRRLPVQARRDIQQEYAIGAARLRQDLSARNIDGGMRLTGHWRGIGLRNFQARQTRRGVTAGALKGKRTLREHTFFASLLGGGSHVVRREGAKRPMKTGRYVGKRRQPLVVEYGPTASQMLRKGRRPDRLVEFARRTLAAAMSDRVNKELRRHGATT